MTETPENIMTTKTPTPSPLTKIFCIAALGTAAVAAAAGLYLLQDESAKPPEAPAPYYEQPYYPPIDASDFFQMGR